MEKIRPLLVVIVLCSPPVLRSASNCYLRGGSCKDCLKLHPKCAWDPQSSVNSQYRCIPRDESSGLFSPQSQTKTKIPNKESDVSLRLGDTISVFLEVELEKRAPVDIYILSDMSFTMKDVLQEVGETADTLRKLIEKDAELVRLGFGGFVEKPTLPFIHMDPLAACAASSEKYTECELPFSYRHYINFTTNMTFFQTRMQNITTKSSVNLDKPESGLDAVLQAAVCPDVITWDSKALKIIAYLTNGGIHIRGDGLLANIIKGPDMKCHMDKRGHYMEYVKALEFDYPSIGMVAEVLEEAGISIVFLVTKDILPLYEQLVKELPSASAAKQPKKQASKSSKETPQIAKILNQNYKTITRLVVLERENAEAASKIHSEISVQCHPGANWVESSACNVKLGGKVRFEIKLTAKECLDSPVNLRFKSKGIDDVVLNINVSTLCSCDDCKEAGEPDQCGGKNSSAKLLCGVCSCPLGTAGLLCECPAKEADDSKCIAPSAKSKKEPCSGKGRCSCGKCLCYEGFGGQYCECSSNCEKDINNKICGGPSRGRCECNGCSCREGFGGEACGCLKKGPSAELDCHNQQVTKLMKDNETCSNEFIKSCVLCHFANTPKGAKKAEGVCNLQCATNEGNVDVTLNDTITSGSTCIFSNADDCRILISHSRKDKQISIVIRRECIHSVVHAASLPIITGVIVGILILGLLLLLIWKLIVYFEDRAEFQALYLDELRIQKGPMSSNPLYQSPHTEVENPLYESSKTEEHSFIN